MVTKTEAQAYVKQIYKKYPGGGPMHVVLDDGNYDTRCIVWCLASAVPKVPEQDKEMFVKVSEYLLDLPENRRGSIWRGAENLHE